MQKLAKIRTKVRQTDRQTQTDKLAGQTDRTFTGRKLGHGYTVRSESDVVLDCEQNDVDRDRPFTEQQKLDRQQTRTDSSEDKNHCRQRENLSNIIKIE